MRFYDTAFYSLPVPGVSRKERKQKKKNCTFNISNWFSLIDLLETHARKCLVKISCESGIIIQY